ncbi:myosin-8-like isoform X1 [Cimex lectularius]|uniref:Dynein regulatory complex protein 10 n=1 Tax=Cimex lectularius TaxID=79782 RepID=A0A8I6RKE3_CIMLE|nr:myosin-8-like isoform X1 [Cimex lectularius]
MSKEEDQRSKKLKDVGTEVLRLLKGEQQAVEKVRVQAEVYKVQKLATQFLDKLTFTMCLPQLIGLSFKMIAMHVTYQELMFIKNTMRNISLKGCSIMGGEDHYGAGRKSHFVTASSASSIEKFYANYPVHKENITNKSIEDLWICADMLYNKPEVQKLCTENMLSQLPPHVRNCIWKLEVLIAEVLLKMLRNPKAEDEGEEGLAEKFTRCENLPEEISEVVSEIRPTVENNAVEVQRGWQQISALEKQKEKLKVFCRNSMLKHAKEMETKMAADRKASEKKQEVILSAVNEIKNKHERTRDENLKKEKDLRNERNKIDEKLKEIINQYNKDMKKKEIILDKLMCSYEKETATLNELTAVFEEQKARYDELMQEKADYERSVWDAKLYEVQKKIAARKIQRFYRSYLAIMLAHGKRGKRGRGKRRK